PENAVSLHLVPCFLDEANAFVDQFHRHSDPVEGHLFSLVAAEGDKVVGVAIVRRPVGRGLQDGWTAEVARVATDGHKNACSFLYGACWRAARALGYRKLVTYTLQSEPGTSLRAAGWRVVGEVEARAHGWNCKSR